MRRVAAYHYGLADTEGNPVRVGSGKALRPALALLSARAAGAAPERGVTPAVAVESEPDDLVVPKDSVMTAGSRS